MADPKNLKNGEEQYEKFTHGTGRRKKSYVQYDYRDSNGKLFSIVRPTLEECRQARDARKIS
ncbi:hypothetical protein AGMMS49975_28620 [Clostridia bacterium]|nr:hypothetical protein AGMMS49975_28620 [Clostridia bacterium]